MAFSKRYSSPALAVGARFREAFPRLNIAAAERGMTEGRDLCVYMRGRRRVGHAECDVTGDHQFLIKYQIIPDMPGMSHERSAAAFEFVTPANSAVRHKRYFLCPACSKQRHSLFFAGHWACAECHRLLRRSQVIPKNAAARERWEGLKKLVGRGRPPGMHSRTYARLREELKVLEAILRKIPFAVASEVHCKIVQEQWLSLDEDADWQNGFAADWWRPGG